MSIQDKFLEFHRNNPQVYALLVKLARQVKEKGYKTYSTKSLFERARWFFEFETVGDQFKLNNNYTSRYSRLISELEPDLKEFFRTRALTA